MAADFQKVMWERLVMNQVWHSARAWRGRERRTFGISGGGFRQASKSIVFVPSRIFKLDHLGVREVRSGSKVQTNSLLECECAQTALIGILLAHVVDDVLLEGSGLWVLVASICMLQYGWLGNWGS